MVFRAIICCTALIFALLAALSATAQSAAAPQPLNLMNFMQGSAKAGSAKAGSAKTDTAGTASAKTASTGKRRHATSRTAARPQRDANPTSAASSEPSVLPVAAATAYAAHSADDVQVVSGDEVNAIDLAMNSSASETNGAASRADGEVRDRFKFADASQFLPNQGALNNTAAPANQAASPSNGTARDDEIARESWMIRFWSAIGDGFVALVGIVRQLLS